MRARNIKPGFYKNESLAECSVWARLLFPGLWMLADRAGRLEDRPKRIKGEILPFDSVEVEPLLQELHTHQHIIRYEIDGIKYIQIPGFLNHQAPHFTEKESLIPPSIHDDFRKKPSLSPDIPKVLPEKASLKRGALPPDSLNPDSLNPESSPTGESARATTKMIFDEIPPDWKAWAMEEKGWTEEVLADVWALFREYWQDGKGKKTKRTNWLPTWRHWCRKENISSPEHRRSLLSFDEKARQKTDLAIEEARKRYAEPS